MAPKAETEMASPPSQTALKLQEIWQSALALDNVGLDDNFFALGGDSLQAVDLFLKIEKSLNQRLPRDILFEAGTIAEMAQLLEDESTACCIVPIKPDGNRPPFFCIHPIGGEVLGYRVLAKYLEKEQPFYGVQQVGANDDVPNFQSIEDMADYYLGEIRKKQPNGPYYLGGHSYGGLIAYVIAQKLLDENEETALLALFDTYAPVNKRHISFLLWLKRHKQIMSTLSPTEQPNYIFKRIRNIFDRGIALVRHKLLSVVRSSLKNSNMPAGRLLRNQDINVLNNKKFVPTPYEGNAVLFMTELPVSFHNDLHDDWKKLVKGKLQIRKISGGHVEIMEEPIVKELAHELTNCLNQQIIADQKTAVVGVGD